ncbi:hypothetical protein D3C72_1950840 [compost metagenome]
MQIRLVHLWTRYQVLMVDAAVMAASGIGLRVPFQAWLNKGGTLSRIKAILVTLFDPAGYAVADGDGAKRVKKKGRFFHCVSTESSWSSVF